VLVDSHVHLQPHGEAPPMDRARLDAYVDTARRSGIARLAITEHLFRFREAYDLLYGWWDADPDPALAAAARAYWDAHVNARIDEYVRLIEGAKRDGLPVLLGLELDWIPRREEELRRLLAPYDWDVIVGSVHWIGAWGIDITPDDGVWDVRDVDETHAAYVRLVDDLARSGLCHVLAHPDLPKIFGHRPRSWEPLRRGIVEAAVAGGIALEVNANGIRKPVGEPYPAAPILHEAARRGIPITLASDAHLPGDVGHHFAEIVAHARAAGYTTFVEFENGRSSVRALPGP
jgi:histidinol-phosphatase (PHP family)